MNPLIQFVQTNSYEFASSHLRLPPFLWTAFTLLNKVHGIWRWHRRAELYQNPGNFTQLLAGHLVNIIVGDSLLIRIGAQCLLAATRILDCSKQQELLFRQGRMGILALQGAYAHPVHLKWVKNQQSHWISPSAHFWLKNGFSIFLERVKRVFLQSIKTLKEAFELSMRMMDAIEALAWNEAARTDGIVECFVNIGRCLEALASNKEALLKGFKENRKIIERLLCRSPITYERIYSALCAAADKSGTVKKAADFGSGILAEMGKGCAQAIF